MMRFSHVIECKSRYFSWDIRGKERNSLKISSPKIIVELGGIRAVVLHENQFFPYINSSLKTEPLVSSHTTFTTVYFI